MTHSYPLFSEVNRRLTEPIYLRSARRRPPAAATTNHQPPNLKKFTKEDMLHTTSINVKTKEMTKKEYNDYRGWELPKNENPEEQGYLVEYQNTKQPPNDSRHFGYISWLPKNLIESETSDARPPYQQRVIDEKIELDLKLQKLQDFVTNTKETNPFYSLSVADQKTLQEQLQAMKLYANILQYRIDRF